MSCSNTDRNARAGNCCCQHCEHDRLDFPGCCKCVPRTLCVSFLPDDPDIDPTFNHTTHNGSGFWSPLALNFNVQIKEGNYDECVWAVTNQQLGFYEEFPVSEYGCLTTDDSYIDITGLMHGEDSGTYRIQALPRVVVPFGEDENGCPEKLCDNCLCLPYCVQIGQRISYEFEGGQYRDETTQRWECACWDSGIGDHGGWEVMFPGFSHGDDSDCWPEVSVQIQLVRDENGDCALQAVVPGYGEALSSSPLDCDAPPFGFFSGSWSFDTVDPTDPYLGAALEIGVLTADCAFERCRPLCCFVFEDLEPKTLTATVVGRSDHPDDYCTDPFEVVLTRQAPGLCTSTPPWYGEAVVPWECPGQGDGPGTVLVKIEFSCSNCDYSIAQGKCVCNVCDAPSFPPAGNCHLLSLEADNLGPEGGFGGPHPTGSICGYFDGMVRANTCDPVYAEFSISLGGLGRCCDSWYVIVTE